MTQLMQPNPHSRQWTRRAWLAQSVSTALAIPPVSGLARRGSWCDTSQAVMAPSGPLREGHSALATIDDWEELAKSGVEAARQAGAQYADVHLTRTLQHNHVPLGTGVTFQERTGVGVRALSNGYWGFAAVPSADASGIVRLAQAAVAQAEVNAKGALPRTVEMSPIPAAVGHWATPVAIDPFTISLEEKGAMMGYWQKCAERVNLAINIVRSELHFVRQVRVAATSGGGCFTTTTYQSGGTIAMMGGSGNFIQNISDKEAPKIMGIETAGLGWELLLNAKIPEQIAVMPEQFRTMKGRKTQPAAVGRYTLVCDGATMAAMMSATLGVATQLDRALGYEANAAGTSFLDDPLAMLGTFKLASPLVTVTANRSTPTQLATVKWDDEGVIPSEIHLVKEGVLTDFQTTREQAAWLAPYYQKASRTIQSNGCAASEDALAITMQHMPNLSLEPGNAATHVEDLVANVKDGLFMERGTVLQLDAQVGSGLLFSTKLRKITNGKLGSLLTGGAIQFNTLDFWRHLIALGGASTQMVVPFSQYPYGGQLGAMLHLPVKGEPPQLASHSAQGVAAIIENQALINPLRKV